MQFVCVFFICVCVYCINSAPTRRPSSMANFSFVRINVPKQGVSILQIKNADVTIGEILAMVQKKRALQPGEHTLELVTQPGVELDPKVTLRELGTNELLLIHKFSKRFDSQDEATDKTKDFEVENSLRIYQYEVCYLSMSINTFALICHCV